MKLQWRGVFPAVTTQFKKDQSLDVESTLKHVKWLRQSGVHGLIFLGTVGENCSLEYAEKLRLLEAAVKVVRRRVPVLTGVAEYTTSLACRYAADAKKAGADGLMALPAIVYKSDPAETVAHFRAVASATDLPVMCYNNPVSYGVDITPAQFAQLAEIPSIAAIKESSENIRRLTDLKNAFGDRFILFGGVDDLALESALLGADGWVSGLANAFPAESCLLWELAAGGQFARALPLYRWFTPLLHLDTRVKLVQCIKLAMAECGAGSETVRAPRLPLAGAEREEVIGLVRRALETRPAVLAAIRS